MSFPLPRTDLPAFEPLMRGRLWRDWEESGMVFPVDDLRAAIHYVRLKPGTSCRIAVFQWDVGSATGPPLGFLLYLYPDAARACAAYEKIAGRPRFPTETSYRHFMDKL
jgi:hypothetical protein